MRVIVFFAARYSGSSTGTFNSWVWSVPPFCGTTDRRGRAWDADGKLCCLKSGAEQFHLCRLLRRQKIVELELEGRWSGVGNSQSLGIPRWIFPVRQACNQTKVSHAIVVAGMVEALQSRVQSAIGKLGGALRSCVYLDHKPQIPPPRYHQTDNCCSFSCLPYSYPAFRLWRHVHCKQSCSFSTARMVNDALMRS